MRLTLRPLFALAMLAGLAVAETTQYPALSPSAQQLVIYSTLDSRLASPLIWAFQANHPDVAVRYEDLLASEIAARVIAETNAGQPSADFLFSSGMDLQLKLANDGYGQEVAVPEARDWPAWAKWQDTAFALTFEPAVLVYHKPSFPAGPPVAAGTAGLAGQRPRYTDRPDRHL